MLHVNCISLAIFAYLLVLYFITLPFVVFSNARCSLSTWGQGCGEGNTILLPPFSSFPSPLPTTHSAALHCPAPVARQRPYKRSREGRRKHWPSPRSTGEGKREHTTPFAPLIPQVYWSVGVARPCLAPVAVQGSTGPSLCPSYATDGAQQNLYSQVTSRKVHCIARYLPNKLMCSCHGFY